MAYVIAVANQKGGVGKTTTATSLAGALAGKSLDVLAVDLDAQANLTLALGFNPTQVHGTSTDVLLNSASIPSVSCETEIPFLSLTPANSGMELAERFLSVRQNYEYVLRDALKSYLAVDYVILDCPPSMGAVTLNAMVAADLLIIPTQSEFFSAHALRSMMSSIRRVRSVYNPGLLYRILITMLDRRNRIHRNLSDQIQGTFAEGIFETVIEVDTKLRESVLAGLPVMQYKANTRSALQYEALAEELLAYVEENRQQPA